MDKQDNTQSLKLLQVSVHPDLIKRLRIVALDREMTASEVVSELLATLPPPPSEMKV